MTQTFDLADEAGRRFLAVAGLVFDFLSIINLSLSDFKGYHKHDPISSMGEYFLKLRNGAVFSSSIHLKDLFELNTLRIYF